MNSDGLGLLGGPPAVTAKALDYPQFSGSAIEEVAAFLRHERGQMQGLSKHHKVIAQFESAFASFFEMPHCMATSSGHGSLQAALIGLEVTGGDHVLTSPYSWGASVSCILHNGGVPVFADVDPDTGLLDPARLGEYVTPSTVAILVPHIFGQPADMTGIAEFAASRGLLVIEDGSQAHGARHRGRRIGSFGDAAGFSNNGVKPVATTEGGFMLARDESVYWKATISAQHAGRGELMGRASEPGFPDELRPYIDTFVYTYRPDCVSAILAIDRLEQLDQDNQARRRHVAQFLDGIADVDLLSAPQYDDADECAFHMLTLNFDEEAAGFSREVMLDALQAEGVPAVAYVARPLNQSPRLDPEWSGPRVMWSETIRKSGVNANLATLPGCEQKAARSIEIPWNLPREQGAYVSQLVDAVRKISRDRGQLRGLRNVPAQGATK